METYNNNFLTEKRKILEKTLLQIAKEIRNKIIDSGYPFLLTQAQKNPENNMTDTLYGYIYGEGIDILEREVKGFYVNPEGALFICMDISAISYKEKDLQDTFNDIDDETWYLMLDTKGNLAHLDSYNVYLTLLSISECIYQYFK